MNISMVKDKILSRSDFQMAAVVGNSRTRRSKYSDLEIATWSVGCLYTEVLQTAVADMAKYKIEQANIAAIQKVKCRDDGNIPIVNYKLYFSTVA